MRRAAAPFRQFWLGRNAYTGSALASRTIGADEAGATVFRTQEAFAGRGLTLEQLKTLELGLDETGNGVIALRGLDGQLLGLKVRLRHPEARKYVEIPDPNGNPPWFPAGSETASASTHIGVLCVEGELNAMLSSLALTHSGWKVVGLGSAFGPVPWEWLEHLGVPVVFSLDPGRVGDKSVRAWTTYAQSRGLSGRRAAALLADWDACKYAHTCGFEALSVRWLQVLRLVGGGSARAR